MKIIFISHITYAALIGSGEVSETEVAPYMALKPALYVYDTKILTLDFSYLAQTMCSYKVPAC